MRTQKKENQFGCMHILYYELLTTWICYIPINIIEKQLCVLSFRSLYVLYYWSCAVSYSLCTIVVISNHSSTELICSFFFFWCIK